ncbi:hypothetical protein TNIN_22671, partial [Trichonephila inaurata madagascariensis]
PTGKSICNTLPKFQKSEMAQAMALNKRLLEPARRFITRCEIELDWEDLSDDTIMDMGCGIHFSCTRALLEKFPRIGCLVAIDIVNVMTKEIREDEFFAEYFGKEILQFRHLDITDCLKNYGKIVNKIVCRNVLQQVFDKEMAFQNMYDLLRPGGHAAILFCIATPVGTCHLRLSSSTNWAQHRRNAIPFFTPANLEEGYYKKLLEKIGFQVVLCERRTVRNQFLDDQSFLRSFLTFARVQFNIPQGRMTQFKEESVKLFKELIGYSGSGPLRYEASDLLLLAIKPQDGKNLDKFL